MGSRHPKAKPAKAPSKEAKARVRNLDFLFFITFLNNS